MLPITFDIDMDLYPCFFIDVEMDEDNQSIKSLKPVGKIGKKLRKKIKMAKRKNRGGKGKIRKKHNV